MKAAKDLIPWKVTDISFRPYKGFWSMNPSIHFDGQLWRCVLRCADYAMSGGVTVRSRKAREGGGVQTKNAMVIFDPASWRPVEIYKARERDDLPRARSDNVGYEDVRIFRTDRGGLQGIAACQHLKRADRSHGQLPEQVLLSFDADYNIVGARPIRGGFWDGTAQKNWAPFDHCTEPRFIYAIGRGILFDDRGVLHDDEALVHASSGARSVSVLPSERGIRRARARASKSEAARAEEERRRKSEREDQSSFGQVDPAQNCDGLRGGTQLVLVGADAWLGIGHAMKFVDNLKYYWHIWYLVDSRGKMKAASPPMKLAPNGIEFAAGLAIDGDRVVVSFGVDDMECKIGETKLSAVMATLQKVER